MSYHHDIMRALDECVMSGGKRKAIKPPIYYAMRRAARKAQMRGQAVQSERELAKLTFAELARG